MNVVDEVGPGSCRLTVEGHITVRLFGIGRLAERIIIESTHKTLHALPAIVERWPSRCTPGRAVPFMLHGTAGGDATWQQPNDEMLPTASALSAALLNNACGPA